MIENLSGTPTWRSSYVSRAKVTTLRRQWPKAVFETLRRRAPDIERLRRDAPNRTDKAFCYSGPGYCGSGCTHGGMPSRAGSIVALSCHMVRSMEGIGTRLPGASGGEAWGIDAGNKNQRGPVFSPLGSNQGRLARRPPTRRIGDRRRRPSVSYQPRWLSGLRRSRVHSLVITRRSLCPEKLGSNPGQGSKGINFSGWHGLDMSITVTKRR